MRSLMYLASGLATCDQDSTRQPGEIRGDDKGTEGVRPVRRDHHPRRPGAQSPGHRPRPASRSPGRLHGGQRFGEELAGLRHHLRRGTAALHRVPLQLRTPVPGPAPAAGRRSDRGPAADRGHRPEGGPGQSRGAPSGRSPRFTTTCGCSTPGWARPSARAADCRSIGRRRSRWPPTCWPFPKDGRS